MEYAQPSFKTDLHFAARETKIESLREGKNKKTRSCVSLKGINV